MKPKILFIMHVPPPVHGAAMVGKFIKESAKINAAFDADYINLSTSKDLKEIGGAGAGKILKLLRIQSEVVKALSKKNYDLCYVTLTASGAGFYKDLMVVGILKMFSRKIIYHFHNKGVGFSGKSALTDALYKFVFNKSFSILLSKSLYYDVQAYAPAANVFFCPNGIPQNALQQKTGPRETNICRLLFLGNLMESKGLLILLQACRIVKEKGLLFECHFVGGWTDITPEQFGTTVSEYGLDGAVFAHGPKYDQEKRDFLSNSDVLVFPTFYHFEAFPLVILEAMQSGLAVISCPEGGIPDIVVEGETGYLVPQRNADALAEKISTLINNPPIRQNMGEAGRERFQQLFTIDSFEENISEILTVAASKQPV